MTDAERRLKQFEDKELCGKAPFIRRLGQSYLAKADRNIMVSSILLKLGNHDKA